MFRIFMVLHTCPNMVVAKRSYLYFFDISSAASANMAALSFCGRLSQDLRTSKLFWIAMCMTSYKTKRYRNDPKFSDR